MSIAVVSIQADTISQKGFEQLQSPALAREITPCTRCREDLLASWAIAERSRPQVPRPLESCAVVLAIPALFAFRSCTSVRSCCTMLYPSKRSSRIRQYSYPRLVLQQSAWKEYSSPGTSRIQDAIMQGFIPETSRIIIQLLGFPDRPHGPNHRPSPSLPHPHRPRPPSPPFSSFSPAHQPSHLPVHRHLRSPLFLSSPGLPPHLDVLALDPRMRPAHEMLSFGPLSAAFWK